MRLLSSIHQASLLVHSFLVVACRHCLLEEALVHFGMSWEGPAVLQYRLVLLLGVGVCVAGRLIHVSGVMGRCGPVLVGLAVV